MNTIKSIAPSPITKKDVTYTLVLEGDTDMVAIGGVFTRAKPEHEKPTKKVLRSSKSHANAQHKKKTSSTKV